MNLTVEQIETIREKHPDFDFEKFARWHAAIMEELRKPMEFKLRKGCEL